MQAGRKRRWRGVIVKDRAMIQGDAPGQAHRQEGPSEHELVGRARRIGRLQTRIALDLEAADRINHGDETDVAHARHVHTALGIQFPLVMGGTSWLGRWGRQWTQLLMGAREFLSGSAVPRCASDWAAGARPSEDQRAVPPGESWAPSLDASGASA